jgi:hypothetical protein
LKTVLSRLVLASSAVFVCESAQAVTIHGGSGIGSFQDIQVPYNEGFEVRGDGTAVQEENVEHSGFLLQAGIGKESRRGAWLWQIFEFDALQIKSSGGPAATQASSYSRLNLESRIAYTFGLGAQGGSVGLKGGVRRSSFNNVSSAHYLQSVMVGLTAGIAGELHGLEASVAFAPVTKFGYSEDGMFGGKDFKKSRSSLFEAGIQYSYALRENVWLDVGMEQEAVKAEIEDVNEYNDLGYGLSVQDSTRPTRSYDLNTVAARVGFRKAF